MRQDAILFPVFAMAGLTFYVGLWMARLRVKAVRNGDLNANYYRLNRGGELPEYLVKVSRNYSNLLEIPLLFYVVAILIYVTQKTDIGFLVLAWIFFLVRMVHTYIHTTYNNVRHRSIPFLLSVVTLIAIWVRLFVQLSQG